MGDYSQLFLPKECVLDDPWDLDPPNREIWVNCAYKKQTGFC